MRKIGEYVLLSGLFVSNHVAGFFLRLTKKIGLSVWKYSSEEDCEYVTSRGIAYSCDVYPPYIKSDEKAFDPSIYSSIKNNDIVYVITKSLGGFIKEILPQLESNDIQITLVTGSSIRGAPLEISDEHGIDYLSLIDKSRVIKHWFTQNYDLKHSHKNITPIPLGLDYHTLKNKSFWWGVQSTPLQQEAKLKSINSRSPEFASKRTKCYSYFQFNMFQRHDADRHKALNALKGKSFSDFASGRRSRKRTWKTCALYKYNISPHGNGLDCHRTYEAIALGALPVVTSSSLDLIYEDLPVIILNDWDEISIPVLEDKAHQVLKHSTEKMKLNYWVDLIKSTSS